MGNLIRASNLRGFNELVLSLGGDPARLLNRFHIAADIEQQPDAFVLFRQLALLLEATADSLRCSDFGMRLSNWQGLSILGPIAVITRNADNVMAALQDIGQYLYIHSPALSLTVHPQEDDDSVWFRYQITETSLPLMPQSYELSMGNAMQILQLLGGHATSPLALHFMHAPVSKPALYRKHLGCPVHFEQPWCGFRLSRAQLGLAIDQADSETHRLAANYLSSFQAPESTLHTHVSGLIRLLLSTGKSQIETVAQQLALHPRTLQRRLTDEGQRFEDLLDEQRRILAAQYLHEKGLHLAQIAGLLGYTEQSSLNRACRRWFNETPRAMRRKLSHKDN